jgi:parvulin-like peptidyl-prolyl isomerase
MTDITSQDLLHQIKITGKMPELLHGILQRQILEETAASLKLEISADELQVGADQFRAANHLETIPATQKWLVDRLLSVDDFEQLVNTNLLATKVAQNLFGNQVAPYFYQNTLNYASAVIYEIILQDQNLAIELFYAIQEGDMSFADAAKTYGQDLETQRYGGYVGMVSRKKMTPEVSAAVFAAQPPQILKPITVGKQIYLILVEEVIKPQLTSQLQEQIMWQLFQDWLQEKIAIRRSSLQIKSKDSGLRRNKGQTRWID